LRVAGCPSWACLKELSSVFGGLGAQELFIIFLVILLLFGAKKLPEMARGMGQAIREFRKGTTEIAKEFENSDRDLPSQSQRSSSEGAARRD